MSLLPGACCEIIGLVAAAQHNGKSCMLTKFNEASGRWQVKLESGEGLAVRPQNLGGKIMPPPPLKQVEESVKAAVAAGDWLGVLEWEGRIEELVEHESQKGMTMKYFVNAHLMRWVDFKEDAVGKEHGREYVILEERRIDLLEKQRQFPSKRSCPFRSGHQSAPHKRSCCRKIKGFLQRARDIGATHGFLDVESEACQNLGQRAVREGRDEEAVELFRHAYSVATYDPEKDNSVFLCLLEYFTMILIGTHALEEAAPLVQRYREAAQTEARRMGHASFEFSF